MRGGATWVKAIVTTPKQKGVLKKVSARKLARVSVRRRKRRLKSRSDPSLKDGIGRITASIRSGLSSAWLHVLGVRLMTLSAMNLSAKGSAKTISRDTIGCSLSIPRSMIPIAWGRMEERHRRFTTSE